MSPSTPTSGCILGGNEIMISETALCSHAYYSTAHNDHGTETTQGCVAGWTDKENFSLSHTQARTHTHTEESVSGLKKGHPAICKNMDGLLGHHTKWNQTERQVLCDHTYTWNQTTPNPQKQQKGDARVWARVGEGRRWSEDVELSSSYEMNQPRGCAVQHGDKN